jgi:hypothetical protein
MNRNISLSLLMFMLLLTAGCSGGGGSSTGSADNSNGTPSGDTGTPDDTTPDNTTPDNTPPDNPLTSGDFAVDESAFNDTSNFISVPGKANNPTVELMPKSSGLSLQPSDLTNPTPDVAGEYRYETNLTQAEVDAKKNEPLFINGEFAGLIDKYENGAIVVKNAEKISDVYQSFDISASNDEVAQGISRSLKSGLGAYDHLNDKPLKFSFSQKDIISKQRGISREPVLTVEFPEGYTVPLRPVASRQVTIDAECSLSEAMCDASFNYDKRLGQDFDESASFGSVTFSTVGSKIEIGLGALIRAKYDYNTISENEYHFEFKPTAYYEINLEASITGSAITAQEYTFDIVQNGLDIPIKLPKGAELNINVKPELVIGMEDSPYVKSTNFKAKLNSTKTGYVRLVYNNNGSSFQAGIKEAGDPLVKAGITVDIDTHTDEIVGYLFPQIAVRPQLGFVKVDKKVNIAYVRNGARIDTKLRGVITEDWVVENTEVAGSSEQDVYLKSELYGLIDYKWDVKVGDTDLFTSDDWGVLYKSKKPLVLLEWYNQFLHSPKVNITATQANRAVTFDIRSGLKNDIRYYYTTNGDDIDLNQINDNRDSTPYSIWRHGDEPLNFSEDTSLNVRAVLFTDEMASTTDTLWRWGMSSSQQLNTAAVYLPAPVIDPYAKEFKSAFNVNASDTAGNTIEYDELQTGVFKECQSPCALTISKTSNVSFRTTKEVNGERYYSDVVIGSYRQCASHEGLDGGSCINQCPFVWDIHYQQAPTKYPASEDGDGRVAGSGSVQGVFIYPRCDFSLGGEDSPLYQKCAPYLNNTPLSSGTQQVIDPGMISIFDSPLSASYAGAYLSGASGLCSRDPYPEMPISWLPAAYKEHFVNMQSYPEQEGDSYSVEGDDNEHNVVPHFEADFVHLDPDTSPETLPFTEDIFAEVYEHKQFTDSSGAAQYTFIPRASKQHDFSDTFCLANPGYCVDKGLGPHAFCTLYPEYCQTRNIAYTPLTPDGNGGNDDDDDEDPDNSSGDDDDNGDNVDGDYDNWESGLWRFHVNFTSTLGSGTMTVENFKIDLAPEKPAFGGSGDFIFVGNDYASYPEGTTLSFSGALKYDSGLSPLTMEDAQFTQPLSKTIKFNALVTVPGLGDMQVGSDEQFTFVSCDGHLPAGSTTKIFNKEKLSWNWNNTEAEFGCDFTLEPMPEG